MPPPPTHTHTPGWLGVREHLVVSCQHSAVDGCLHLGQLNRQHHLGGKAGNEGRGRGSDPQARAAGRGLRQLSNPAPSSGVSATLRGRGTGVLGTLRGGRGTGVSGTLRGRSKGVSGTLRGRGKGVSDTLRGRGKGVRHLTREGQGVPATLGERGTGHGGASHMVSHDTHYACSRPTPMSPHSYLPPPTCHPSTPCLPRVL